MNHNPRRYEVGQKLTLIGFSIPGKETASLFNIFMHYQSQKLTVDETRFYFKEVIITSDVIYDELGEEAGFIGNVVGDESLVAHNRYPEYSRTNDPFLHVRLNNMWVLRSADTEGYRVGKYHDDMIDIKLALSFMDEMGTPELKELAELINVVKPQ